MEKEVKEEVKEEVVELTEEQKKAQIEETLITEGVMIPASDLVHYMTRNASYMRLINSEEFKESGIDLEKVLDDTFIREQFQQNAETARMMRFVTESIVPLMQEKPQEVQLEEAKQIIEEASSDKA